jgi:LemA family.
MTFPSNIIANLFSFTKKEVFAIPEEEKVNPDVKKLVPILIHSYGTKLSGYL